MTPAATSVAAATIVVGSGVDRAGIGSYPRPPTRLLLPDGPRIGDGAITVDHDTTLTSVYRNETPQE